MKNIKKISIIISALCIPIYSVNAATNDNSSQELKQLISKYQDNGNEARTDSADKVDPKDLNQAEQDIEKKKMELWKEYLRAKEESEAKKDGVIVSQGKANVQPSTSDVNNTENKTSEASESNKINTEDNGEDKSVSGKRFTCVVVSNIKGAQINEKRNFEIHEDSIPKTVVFAIENQGRAVYINDGMNFPFLRFKPNILQRYIPFMEKNEIVETWIFDPAGKKALFSQLKTGEDIGNSGKTMVGDISNMVLSDDCNQIVDQNQNQN